jgi:hypothetical protein
MRLTSSYTRVAAPHGVVCPSSISSSPHKIGDIIVELFPTKEDVSNLITGQAGMPCPVCGKFLTFPDGFWKEAKIYTGTNKIYWSRAVWDTWSDARKDYVRGHVPNVEEWLR